MKFQWNAFKRYWKLCRFAWFALQWHGMAWQGWYDYYYHHFFKWSCLHWSMNKETNEMKWSNAFHPCDIEFCKRETFDEINKSNDNRQTINFARKHQVFNWINAGEIFGVFVFWCLMQRWWQRWSKFIRKVFGLFCSQLKSLFHWHRIVHPFCTRHSASNAYTHSNTV